jgi:6-phosphofructokinase 1
MKKIGIITSGGDSPGMNACIRAIVRTAVYHNIEVIGFYKGYEGVIDKQFIKLTTTSVSGIIQRGGTMLKTARSERFYTDEGVEIAAKNLKELGVDGFVVIGGDGSFKGAIELSKKINIPIIGCAGTIDNDLYGTDFTIGYDTAINTVIDAVDKIRDTADSHDRVFVIEVMGRDAGLIALRSAIASGAEGLLVPELKNDIEILVEKMKKWGSSKSSKIVIVAEGEQYGGAYKVADLIKENCPEFDVRVTVLGHIQRGGNPSCMERVNASLVGYNAVMALKNGHKNEMVGIINKKIVFTPFEKAVKHIDTLDKELLNMIEVLSN